MLSKRMQKSMEAEIARIEKKRDKIGAELAELTSLYNALQVEIDRLKALISPVKE